jgi:predicted lipoprotein with Yx(FWY)xxD motif
MATRKTPLRIGLVAALAATVAVVAVGWQGSASSKAAAQRAAATATVQTKRVKGLGVVLVNSKGLTLYMLVPDHQKRVTCKGTCAVIWPPLKVKRGQKPTAGGAARKRLLGTYGRVVSYNRWPLYTYIKDHKPGQATGQGVDDSYGKWYVLSPTGRVIKR